MNAHERSLTLAAVALDFPLSTQEAVVLERHLATCPGCALAARRLRDDAAGIAAMERLPAPPEVRGALVRAATGRRDPAPHAAGMRWSLVAALVALLAVGGTFVAGAVLDRIREPGPAPTDPALVVRPTELPQPTTPAIPAPTVGRGWQDLGLLGTTVDGRTVQLVLPGPDGGLVAIGRDQVSTLPVVWTSDDGSRWTITDQPDAVFGGRVPTDGVLHDGSLWVVGWQIAAQGPQRAVWSSSDGVAWQVAGGGQALLGTEASGLDITAGPAGLMVWAPDGRAWTSTDGTGWTRSDAGVTGVADAAVDDAFRLVGRDAGRAFLVTSKDGRSWSAPARQTAATDARVGIEQASDDTLLAWVDARPYRVTAEGWQAVSGAADVPTGEVVGGEQGFGVVDDPTSDGVQRGWIGDGAGDWQDLRSDPTARGARTLVSIAPYGHGWYVLTRQGSAYRGWHLS